MAPKKISVLIVDDHTIVRQGLKELINSAPDMEVVGEAENGLKALSEARRLMPSIIILDLAMPLLNGIETTRRLRRNSPETKILILSTYHDDQEVQQALEAGASGFLIKETASGDLLKAIRETLKGTTCFSPRISRRMLRRTQNSFRKASDPIDSARLTARELQVLERIAQGMPNKGIADSLTISIKTVEKHRQSLMDKLQIHEAASLTRHAIARGMIPCTRPALVEITQSLSAEPTTKLPQ